MKTRADTWAASSQSRRVRVPTTTPAAKWRCLPNESHDANPATGTPVDKLTHPYKLDTRNHDHFLPAFHAANTSGGRRRLRDSHSCTLIRWSLRSRT